MKLKLKITRHTTNSELVHLGNFFTALALNKGAKVFAAPTDPAELDEGDVTYVPTPPLAADVAIVNATDVGNEPPKKRRRTKAEIEAEIAEREAVNKPAATDPDPHQAIVEEAAEKATATTEGEAGNDQPAATQPATVTDGVEKEAAASTPATASPSEPPTPVSLNIKATAVAKKIGPEKIKAKIVELGGKLISTLSPEALVEFDAWLDAQ